MRVLDLVILDLVTKQQKKEEKELGVDAYITGCLLTLNSHSKRPILIYLSRLLLQFDYYS